MLGADNDRLWQVVRQRDGAVLVRYASKAKALAAVLRFGSQGVAWLALIALGILARWRHLHGPRRHPIQTNRHSQVGAGTAASSVKQLAQ